MQARRRHPCVEKADRTKWRTDYNAFLANFQPDASGKFDLSAVKELKAAVEEVVKQEADGDVGDEELAVRAKLFEAVGEITWETTQAEADVPGGDWTARLNMPPLPQPLSIGFFLDEAKPGNWQQLKTGDRVRFTGRFVDFVDGDLEVEIQFPDEAGGQAGAAGSDVGQAGR